MPSPKASSGVANLLSPLHNHPRIAESLSSHKLVDGPVPFDMTHTEEDFRASDKMYFSAVEKLAQKVYTSIQPVTATCEVSTKTRFCVWMKTGFESL